MPSHRTRPSAAARLRLTCAALALTAAAPAPATTARVQAALEAWLAARQKPEGVTGVAAYISAGDPGPAIEAYAGRNGRDPADPPVGRHTLFQMGSRSKSFAAAILLKLEAAGKLSLDDRLGKYLPQYPAWKDVTLRRLLNMTSGLPNYTETKAIVDDWVNTPERNLSPADLIAYVYPTPTNRLSSITGYSYSNTNYILAGMVAEKIAGRPYRDLVHDMLFAPLGLDEMYYADRALPPEITARMAHGYFENPACADYQPNCKVSWAAPLQGHDVRALNLSWAGAAGGGIAEARDVDLWMRAVFAGRVVPPKQQKEWLALVSNKTGQPIADVSSADPKGFSLGLARALIPRLGPVWFYQGETLGYRTLYVWFDESGIMITVQTNSQPAGERDELHNLVTTLYQIVKP